MQILPSHQYNANELTSSRWESASCILPLFVKDEYKYFSIQILKYDC